MTVDERAMGSLWGLAWGDVLGCPIEGWSATEIATVFGAYQLPDAGYPAGVPAGKRARLRPLGLHSDDTQQALALINVCRSGWSPDAWARCLVAGARLKSWRGTGRHFEGAVAKLGKGASPQSAGSPSAGIGAAMRAAPLGALYRDQSRRLVEVTMEASAVTHADLRSAALAYAVAWSSAQLVGGSSAAHVRSALPDAIAEAEDEWLHGKKEWAIDRMGRHELSLGLARVLAAVTTAPTAIAESATRAIAALGAHVTTLAQPFLEREQGRRAPGHTLPASHPNHGFALLGGVFGLVAGLLDDLEPSEVLLAIVRLGEDTDTVAAIAGGVLGARFGSDWVPKHRVQDHVRVEQYAKALVTPQAHLDSIDALLRHEATLTAQELAFQADTTWPR